MALPWAHTQADIDWNKGLTLLSFCWLPWYRSVRSSHHNFNPYFRHKLAHINVNVVILLIVSELEPSAWVVLFACGFRRTGKSTGLLLPNSIIIKKLISNFLVVELAKLKNSSTLHSDRVAGKPQVHIFQYSYIVLQSGAHYTGC